MKIFLSTLLFVILFLLIYFGAWGYIKAQEIKDKGKEIERISQDTLNLVIINQDNSVIDIAPWEQLSKKASSIDLELKSLKTMPENLISLTNEYYGIKAKDKYEEIQYLQILIETQQKLDLKNTEPKTKAQIESILAEYVHLRDRINQNNFSLDPEFNEKLTKFDQESISFKKSLQDLSSKMNSTSRGVQISSAELDKSIDEFKFELINSLNKYVKLQNEIKKEISLLVNTNWINPIN